MGCQPAFEPMPLVPPVPGVLGVPARPGASGIAAVAVAAVVVPGTTTANCRALAGRQQDRELQLFAPERAVLTLVKVFVSCVPTAVMVAMMTTEMRAAIRHIMAVAPNSSRKKDASALPAVGRLEVSDFIWRSFVYGAKLKGIVQEPDCKVVNWETKLS